MAEAYRKTRELPEIFESYFLSEIVDEKIIILLQLLDRSRFDIEYVFKENKGSICLFEMTELLGAVYELDWLPQMKPKE
jgi:hypothetical protein